MLSRTTCYTLQILQQLWENPDGVRFADLELIDQIPQPFLKGLLIELQDSGIISLTNDGYIDLISDLETLSLQDLLEAIDNTVSLTIGDFEGIEASVIERLDIALIEVEKELKSMLEQVKISSLLSKVHVS